jgi:ribonuclease BN (tRNA processing enzyme)
MKLRVLGCSGGIGGTGGFSRTTSLLLDEDILIDAGTGLEDLTVEQLERIDHVFLTHSHLDHVSGLPLMIDSIGARRHTPLQVHALPETIEALKAHVFNWVIWPDFTQIPHHDRPWLSFVPLQTGEVRRLGDRAVQAIAANHTVPAVGYALHGPEGALVFSGDTWPTEAFWRTVNAIPGLRHLIIETAFPNRERDLAVTAKHLFPIELASQLHQLRTDPQVWVTHLKPSDALLITREVQAWAGRFHPRVLTRGEVLAF